MSKYESLEKQVQLFEKVAVYGSRKDFLASIAQNLSTGTVAFPDEGINTVLGSVVGSINNLVNLLSENLAVSTPEGGVLKNYVSQIDTARVPSYVTDKAELDAKANPLKALLGNSMATAMNVQKQNQTNLSGDASQAHDAAGQVVSESKRAINLINVFYRNHGISMEDLSSYEVAEQPVAAPSSAKPAVKQNLVNAAKSLAASVEAAVDKLPTGPNRAGYLGQLNQYVKTLQNYFTRLQNEGGMQGYFARMEIVSALQKLYSALDYADLEHVSSLEAGRGVPETPDSKLV